MENMIWRDAHLSGKFEATLDQWNAAASELTGPLRTDVFALTEVGGVKRLALPVGWGQYSPSNMPGLDGLIAWDGSVFRQRPVAKGAELLTDLDFGDRRGVGLTWVLLRDLRNGGTLLRFVSHWPAHVQQGDSFRRGKKVSRRDRASVRAWKATEGYVGPFLADLIERHDPDAVVGSSDFNVDLLRRVWVKRLNGAHAEAGLHVLAPTEGTHGKRAIDAFVTDAKRRRKVVDRKGRRPVEVLDDGAKPFDHRGVFVDLLAAVE